MNRMELDTSRRPSRASLVGMAVVAAIVLGIPLVSLWGFVGPYAWISRFQGETFGRVYARSTSILLIASSLPMAAFVIYVLGSMGLWRDREGKTWHFPWERDPFWSDRARAWTKLHGYSVAMGATAALLALLSLGEAGLAIRFHSHEAFEAELAENGKPPQSKWLRAFGHPLVDKSVKVSDGGEGSLEDRYVPIVSREWNVSKPIAVFLKVTTRNFEALVDRFTSSNYEGLYFRPGLPPPVRAEFGKNELTVVGDPIVLDWERTPKQHAWNGGIESAIAALLAAGSILLWRSRRRTHAVEQVDRARAA